MRLDGLPSEGLCVWWLESQLPRSGFKSVEIRRVAFDHDLVDGLRQVVNTAGVNLDFVIIMQLTYPYVTELGPRWDYLLGQWVMLEVTTRIRVSNSPFPRHSSILFHDSIGPIAGSGCAAVRRSR